MECLLCCVDSTSVNFIYLNYTMTLAYIFLILFWLYIYFFGTDSFDTKYHEEKAKELGLKIIWSQVSWNVGKTLFYINISRQLYGIDFFVCSYLTDANLFKIYMYIAVAKICHMILY